VNRAPGFPCALCFQGTFLAKLGREARAEVADVRLVLTKIRGLQARQSAYRHTPADLDLACALPLAGLNR
jgi:hypothetical protein